MENKKIWQTEPATKKQKSYLIKLGCSQVPETKFNASELIRKIKLNSKNIFERINAEESPNLEFEILTRKNKRYTLNEWERNRLLTLTNDLNKTQNDTDDANGFLRIGQKFDKMYLPDLLNNSKSIFSTYKMNIGRENKGKYEITRNILTLNEIKAGKMETPEFLTELEIIEEIKTFFEDKLKTELKRVENWNYQKGETKKELIKDLDINKYKRALKILNIMEKRGYF